MSSPSLFLLFPLGFNLFACYHLSHHNYSFLWAICSAKIILKEKKDTVKVLRPCKISFHFRQGGHDLINGFEGGGFIFWWLYCLIYWWQVTTYATGLQDIANQYSHQKKYTPSYLIFKIRYCGWFLVIFLQLNWTEYTVSQSLTRLPNRWINGFCCFFCMRFVSFSLTRWPRSIKFLNQSQRSRSPQRMEPRTMDKKKRLTRLLRNPHRKSKLEIRRNQPVATNRVLNPTVMASQESTMSYDFFRTNSRRHVEVRKRREQQLQWRSDAPCFLIPLSLC